MSSGCRQRIYTFKQDVIPLDNIVRRQVNMRSWYLQVHKAYHDSRIYYKALVGPTPFCTTPRDKTFRDIHISAALNLSDDLKFFYEVLTEEYQQICYDFAFRSLETCKKNPFEKIRKSLTKRKRSYEYIETRRGDLDVILRFLNNHQRKVICCSFVSVKKCIYKIVYDNCNALDERHLMWITKEVMMHSKIPYKDFSCNIQEEVCESPSGSWRFDSHWTCLLLVLIVYQIKS